MKDSLQPELKAKTQKTTSKKQEQPNRDLHRTLGQHLPTKSDNLKTAQLKIIAKHPAYIKQEEKPPRIILKNLKTIGGKQIQHKKHLQKMATKTRTLSTSKERIAEHRPETTGSLVRGVTRTNDSIHQSRSI